MASRMLFPTSTQESSRGLPDTNDLCLGLQSLNLTGWDRPWSTQDSDAAAQTSTQSGESADTRSNSCWILCMFLAGFRLTWSDVPV